ncbi:MAG: class IV adenylate cyclase [Candidatus Woesearchaeota archaeon]
MKEIEVKAKINDFDNLIMKLKELGCNLGEELIQCDIIFKSNKTDFSNIKRGENILRIRDENGKFKLTLKRSQENSLDCIENEVVIDDDNQMREILLNLGYKEVLRINKLRRKFKFKDYEICLDDVEELGKFIEVEKISEEDSKKVQEELFRFLKDLGIREENRIEKGYDNLMWEKMIKKDNF